MRSGQHSVEWNPTTVLQILAWQNIRRKRIYRSWHKKFKKRPKVSIHSWVDYFSNNLEFEPRTAWIKSHSKISISMMCSKEKFSKTKFQARITILVSHRVQRCQLQFLNFCCQFGSTGYKHPTQLALRFFAESVKNHGIGNSINYYSISKWIWLNL